MDDPNEVEIDPELEDLVPIFLGNRREDVGRLRNAVEAGDWDAVENLGHAMKGMGGAYGFDPISELGGDLERLAGDRDLDAVTDRIDRLERYLDRVKIRVPGE